MRCGTGNKNMDREFIVTYHYETCGLFLEDGSFIPASNDLTFMICLGYRGEGRWNERMS
jgi:hypothetical protein